MRNSKRNYICFYRFIFRNGCCFFWTPLFYPKLVVWNFIHLYSIYGIKSSKDNIGHDAHLGGALVGMTVALLLQPTAFLENYLTILVIAVPTIAFIYLIITRPQILLVDNFYFKNRKNYYSIDHKNNDEKVTKQKEID